MANYSELVKEAIRKAHEEADAKAQEIKEAAKAEVKAFEIGKTYYTRSICDHECIFSVEILKRTAKMVTVLKEGKEKRYMSIKIETLDNKKGVLIEGNIFKATDKMGKSYKYRYEGIDQEQETGYYIHLHNLDNNTETYVEKEWFRQRKIVIC